MDTIAACIDRLHASAGRHATQPSSRELSTSAPDGADWGPRRREVVERADRIAECLQDLPGIQQQILVLYAHEGLSWGEIAEVFDRSTAEVRELHAQSLLALNAGLLAIDSVSAFRESRVRNGLAPVQARTAVRADGQGTAPAVEDGRWSGCLSAEALPA